MSGPKRFRGLVAVVLIAIIGAAVFYAVFGDPSDPQNVNFDDSGPRIVALSALAFVFLASFIFGQPKVREIVQGTLFWGGLCALLITGYTYRADLVQAGYRVLGALAPGLAVTQADGTILIVRDAGGHFVVDARTNGARTQYLLDTGASAVVLTFADARRAGYRPQDLSFTVPVSTANGRTLVAPVKIDEITIGDHTVRDIRGFVARQGTLEASLLGMSALDRLRSWRIEGDRLIMTPQGPFSGDLPPNAATASRLVATRRTGEKVHCAVQPPSIGIVVPVTLCATGLQSQSASEPISDGSEVRRDGCFSARRSAIPLSRSPPNSAARASTWGSMIAVSVQPGAMQFTVTPPCALLPARAYSSAATLLMPTSPNLDAT